MPLGPVASDPSGSQRAAFSATLPTPLTGFCGQWDACHMETPVVCERGLHPGKCGGINIRQVWPLTQFFSVSFL